MALIAAFILNNFFGTSFIIYSIAPIGWLLIGWISAAYGKLETSESSEPAAEKSEWLHAKRISY
jgi:hypothetical protein